MTMRIPFLNGLALCCLTLAAASCASDEQPAAEETAELKAKAAQQALVAGDRRGDPCATHGWYADGECDSFCANADSDCDNDEEPVACTLIEEISNGVCGRPASDPCRFQDPDCSLDPTPPVAPGSVACAAFIEVSDNVCSRPENDPCRSQDPDCGDGAPGCTSILLPSDGVCSPHPANGPCGVQDPDCVPPDSVDPPVQCPTIFLNIPSDGVCPPHPNDPCFQDPDCIPGGGGQPSCEPVACTLIEEASDGVCSRPIDDPCKSQDPDCSTDPVVCALFIEAADGVCSRFANDPCIGQDPDCRLPRR